VKTVARIESKSFTKKFELSPEGTTDTWFCVKASNQKITENTITLDF